MADRQAAPRRRSESEDEPRKLRGLPSYVADESAGNFDRLVHERVRLGMLSALAVNRELTFSELRDLLKTSDGNLSVHARKLEQAGYVGCNKSFRGRVPRTEYSLTVRGRRALERYLSHMEALIRATRRA